MCSTAASVELQTLNPKPATAPNGGRAKRLCPVVALVVQSKGPMVYAILSPAMLISPDLEVWPSTVD